MTKILAIALETVGVVAIIVGIGIEAVMKADAGFITITVGSLLIAAGSLLWAKFLKK